MRIFNMSKNVNVQGEQSKSMSKINALFFYKKAFEKIVLTL